MQCEPEFKVLIVAEHASAKFGGEALIPFQYFNFLRKRNSDVHLLVHERTQRELHEAFPDDTGRIHFVPDSRLNVWCAKLGRYLPDRLATFTLGMISHYTTQARQRRLVRNLVREQRFDLVHEPIPVSPKLPSLMFSVGAPVIIGPMNGGMDYPPTYNDSVRWIERAMISILRGAAGFWNEVWPGKRRADLLLVANARAYNALPANLKSKRVLDFVENGVDLDRFFVKQGSITKSKIVQLIYVGRLVDWKRVDLLLDACGRLLGKLNFKLHIVGDGPLRETLKERTRKLCLGSDVEFHGYQTQAATAIILRNCDIMVLPSMRECGGAVVLEAMASGMPVIAAKWGGPIDYVTDETGILIPPATPAEFTIGLASAIEWMANNPDARMRMGQAGRRRVEKYYDWRVKIEELLRIYADVLNSSVVTTKISD